MRTRTRLGGVLSLVACVLCVRGGVAQTAPGPALPAAPDTIEAPPHGTACDAQGDLKKANNALQAAEDTLGRYVGTAECTVKDPTAFPIVENQNNALQAAMGLTLCARRELDAQLSDAGSKIQREMQDVGQALAIAGARMKTQQAVLDAQKAVADAKKAKNVDDAKAAAKAGGDAAKTAREALRIASNECIRTTLKQVEDLADLAQIQVDLRQSAPDSMCGADGLGLPRRTCGIYGVSAAALSFLWAADSEHLRSGRRLTSVGVPAGGFRYTPWSWLAVDLAGYSAFITKSLASASPSVDKVSCAKSPTEYENRLPCEASNEMSTYFGVYAGVTMGRKGVGFVTLAPITAGIAQLGSRATLVPYVGISVGVLQLNGSF